jgi:hypothetical protein
MTDEELDTVIAALGEIRDHASEWGNEYVYNRRTNEFTHRDDAGEGRDRVLSWFNLKN